MIDIPQRNDKNSNWESGYHALAGITDDAVCWVDAASGRLRDPNAAFRSVFSGEVAGRSDATIFDLGLTGERYLRGLLDAAANGDAAVHEMWTDADGADPHCLEVRLVPLSDGDLLFRARTIAATDVTPTSQDVGHTLGSALDEISDLQHQLVHQERMRALGEIARGVAHDLNNMLGPIVGFTELLLAHPEKLDDKKKLLDWLQMMNSAARESTTSVQRLRGYYRAPDISDMLYLGSLNRVVEHALFLTQPQWRDDARLRGVVIDVETDLQEVPLVAGIEPELRDVLVHLILNATDALRANGTLSIRTRSTAAAITIEVEDTGVGMAPEIIEQCMDPFFTTKKQAGSGLGLPVVNRSIQRQDGTIEIASEPGKGTTFNIHLPATLGFRQIEDEEADASTMPQPVPPRRILVADHEALVRRTVIELLMTDGHTVELARNGEECLNLVRQEPFDVVLLDRAAADISGDRLAILVKEAKPDLPVIMMTGFGDDLALNGSLPPSVDYALKKPALLRELRDALWSVDPSKKSVS